MKCERCKWSYPDWMVIQLQTSVKNEHNGKYLCGICALEVINEIHNIRRIKFEDGSKAEYYRQRALSWRKTHPKEQIT